VAFGARALNVNGSDTGFTAKAYRFSFASARRSGYPQYLSNLSAFDRNNAFRDREPVNASPAPSDRDPFVEHLQDARDGSDTALGWLLDAYRQYLLAIAHQQLDPELRAKVAISDVVQQTVMEALAHFGRFEGQTPEQWAGWLCRILANNVADARRHWRDCQKRQVHREVSLGEAPLAALAELLVSGVDSPSAAAIANEEETALRHALAALSGADRQLVVWRSFERLPFEAIGRRLGCSAEAARKRWARAVEQLGQSLESLDESHESKAR
jgi:RNA polymerase sigma-70 factor (subfamily 1)